MIVKTFERSNPALFWESLVVDNTFAEVYAKAWAGREPYQFLVTIVEEDGTKQPPRALRQVLAGIRADYIKSLQEKGFSPQYIIQHLGITRQRFYQIVNKFGLEKSERVPKQQITQLIQEGNSIKSIAEKFKGVSESLVLGIEKKLHTELATLELQHRKEQFLVLFWSHQPNKKIYEELQITEGSGRGYASRLDAPFKGRNAEYVNRLLCEGLTLSAVAERRGVSNSTTLRNLTFYKEAEDRYSREIPRTISLEKLLQVYPNLTFIQKKDLAWHEDPDNYTDDYAGPPLKLIISSEVVELGCTKEYVALLQKKGIKHIAIWWKDTFPEELLVVHN